MTLVAVSVKLKPISHNFFFFCSFQLTVCLPSYLEHNTNNKSTKPEKTMYLELKWKQITTLMNQVMN